MPTHLQYEVCCSLPGATPPFNAPGSATHKSVHNKIEGRRHTGAHTAKQKNAVKVIRATPASDFIAGT